MAKGVKRPIPFGRCAGKAPNRKGPHYTRRVYAEALRRASNISKASKSYTAMTIADILILGSHQRFALDSRGDWCGDVDTVDARAARI
jgi:hypothetical protein